MMLTSFRDLILWLSSEEATVLYSQLAGYMVSMLESGEANSYRGGSGKIIYLHLGFDMLGQL